MRLYDEKILLEFCRGVPWSKEGVRNQEGYRYPVQMICKNKSRINYYSGQAYYYAGLVSGKLR
jgi:sulfate adenylyltransferase subunit 1 (EFTu-like GTPase family)